MCDFYDTYQPIATDVEGIFRLSGSEKRIKELRNSFNSPDRYGKGLDWSGYTVHDAANILRRYFNQLPEPIIPLDFYELFRNPIRNHQSQAVGPMEGQSPSEGQFNVGEAIIMYQGLIKQLPPLNRQLLLYILDLLAVFASKADQNKMTTPNLAAIFQPGLLSHPAHDMAPPEYRLSQDVLIFLIEHQDHFLIGMQGTAADAKTVQEVESGPPTPNNYSSNARSSQAANVVRSISNSSKHSGVRRSASASSRRSKTSVTPSPVGSGLHTPTSGGMAGSGVHRSNTLPTSRSPNLTHARFGKESLSGPMTPPAIQETPVASVEKHDRVMMNTDSKLHSQPLLQEVMTPAGEHMMSLPKSGPIFDEHVKNQRRPPAEEATGKPSFIQMPASATPSRAMEPASPLSAPSNGSRPLSSFFASRSPPADARKPNKLQKKRSPFPSAHSSTHDLNESYDGVSMASINSSLTSQALLTPRAESRPIPLDQLPLKSPPPIGDNYRPANSPTTSNMSYSDVEGVPDQEMLSASYESRDGSNMDAKRRHWFNRSKEGSAAPSLGSNGPAANSKSSVHSSEGGRKSINLESRRSVQLDRIPSSSEQNDLTNVGTSEAEREGRKSGNPVKWLKGKIQDRAERRDRSRDDKRLASPVRGNSAVESQAPAASIGSVVSASQTTVPSSAGSEKMIGDVGTDAGFQRLEDERDVSEKKALTPDTIVPVEKQLSSLPEEPADSAEYAAEIQPANINSKGVDVLNQAKPEPLSTMGPAPTMAPISTQAQAQARTQVESQAQAQVQTQVQPQVQSQVQPQVQPQIQSQVQPQIQPQAQSQIQPQIQPQTITTSSVIKNEANTSNIPLSLRPGQAPTQKIVSMLDPGVRNP